MARLGLGEDWRALFVNDFDPRKAESYKRNFNANNELRVCDVAAVESSDIPKGGVLAWASFPCQDLSLAGNGAGLAARRSGSYWPFWRLMKGLALQGTPVPIVAIENVVGLLSSNGGKDFGALLSSLCEIGYVYGAMVVDAVHFLPQSRPRLFIVAVRPEHAASSNLIMNAPAQPWHPAKLVTVVEALPPAVRANWVWWRLPKPSARRLSLDRIILDQPSSVSWHSPLETQRILSLMSPAHRRMVDAMGRIGRRVVGTIYKRTRHDRQGRKVQRAEVRFDGIAGCLRTPAGGSSRQTIIVVDGHSVRTRLIDSREAARLMGVPEWYELPARYNDAYHLLGDGLAVPAVSWIERHLLRPLAGVAAGRAVPQEYSYRERQPCLILNEAKGSYRARSPARRRASSSATLKTSKHLRIA